MPLSGRRILLGVTGGIAAYKAAELLRRLQDAGAEVRVVMTRHAAEFVTPMTFQALSGHPVRDTLFDPAHEAAMGHIELARWPDLILVAPCSANTLAKAALGLADNLLSTLLVATDKPLMIAPAMNRLMWAHPATQAHAATLTKRGVTLVGPGDGAQACGEIGAGRMSEPATVRDAVIALLSAPTSRPLAGTKAVITAGPTREAIDPVRFITNRSSGKQGYAVATALRDLGADVTLISGPVALPAPAGVTRVEVETAEQMLAATLQSAAGADLLVAAAAVADYRMTDVAAHKIKKHSDTLSLALQRNPDILATVRAAQPGLFMVGFAAETERLAEHARDKLARKHLNLIAANQVGAGLAFDVDTNALQVFWADGQQAIAQGSKQAVAQQLAELIAHHYLKATPAA
ncbi:MAG: bifunctional phosphopantothenoylcysteine decarboxylase/phosphopantothenate--cysteine ligase CoaBC [Polycyclovorans sp.]|nr:bifunctional phosphopantothenoylcysteine decarboxylase/phosphopantothenate--cysteine ligase CoaBC [Polycyclovorans sp.]